jgi:ATPase subunit of ABC transporter with duplicated ATPase domains
LDANGLEHLTDALKNFEGGVVLVSHDELLVRRVLRSSEYSELLICDDGRIRRESGGLRGLDSYRRAAFREQYIRAEAAAKKAEETLQRSREERRRPRGRKGVSASAASTREPTPEVQSCAQAQAAVPVPTGSKPSLDKLFKKGKPKSMNFNAKPK